MNRAVVALGLLLISAQSAEAQKARTIFKAGGVPLSGTAPTVTLSSPSDSATNVSINPTLSYSYTNSPTLCTLYFDDVNPPVDTFTDISCSYFQPGPLVNSTEYFWKIKVENSYGSETSSIRSFTTASSSPSSLLDVSDFSCAGVGLTATIDTAKGSTTHAPTTIYPVAMRKVAGVRHYFEVIGNGDIIEFLEPTLQPCSTAFGSLTPPSILQNWGQLLVHSGDGYIPGEAYTYIYGLTWDETLGGLIQSWTPTYSNFPQGLNSFAFGTLNTGPHTITTVFCAGLSSTPTPYSGSGVLLLPDDFVSDNLPTGARWAVGLGGGLATVGSGISLGPTLTAVVPPSSNACATNTDYPISSKTILSRYPSNSTGPTCNNGSTSGSNLGCTPPTAPTTPYPATSSMTNYSADVYQTDWDPYGGHGWYIGPAIPKLDWYDDGVKNGIVTVFLTAEGWSNTTTAASPTPTWNGGTNVVVFAPTSLSANDGHNIQVGDVLYVNTCLTGVTNGCVATNNNNLSGVLVTAINSGTITATIVDYDLATTGSHAPIVGGPVYMGLLYAHGGTGFVRSQFRLQIYDIAQLAEVVATTRQSYAVSYNSETAMDTLMPSFGCPGCALPGVFSYPSNHTVTSVISDPDAQQVIVIVRGAIQGIGVVNNAIYVLDVNH